MQSVDNSLPQCSKDVKAGELEGFENPLYHTTRGDNEHIYESLVDYNDQLCVKQTINNSYYGCL